MIEPSEMPRERFPAYRDNLVREYAQDKVRAGIWSSEEAPRRAATDIESLLPDGTDSGGHYLYLLRDPATGDEVGVVWIAVLDTGGSVWIYDIEVYEGFRRQDYATQALQTIEDRAAELGADSGNLAVKCGTHRPTRRDGHDSQPRALQEEALFPYDEAL